MRINEDAREKLLAAVNGLTDKELNEKPADDKWSIKEILEHLCLIEGGIIKTIQSELLNGNPKEASHKPIESSLDRSIKIKAPKFAQPSDDFKTLKELKIKLSATHDLLRNITDTTPLEQLEKRAYLHPVFGEMSLKQWIPFIGYHELRHIEQIEEVEDSLKNAYSININDYTKKPNL